MSTLPTYTPRADTLPAQVCAFLMRNPDEELTVEDICAKFDAPRSNIHTQLSRCLDAGLLIRGKNEDDEYVYSIGHKLTPSKVQPPVDTLPSSAALEDNQQQSQTRIKTKLKGKKKIDFDNLPDFSSLPIDTDAELIVNMQGRQQGRIKIDFGPLFQRLGIGHSVVLGEEFFYVARSRISDWHKTHDERFTLKLLADKQIRVGRVS